MTVIAWDGTTLAGDRQAVCASQTFSVQKIHRVGGALIGISGNADKVYAFRQWIEDARPVDKYLTFEPGEYFAAIVVDADRTVRVYERTPFGYVVEDAQHAIGSGRDFARLAMYLGKSAREAVELAALFSADCGNGVDVLALEPSGSAGDAVG